MRYKIDEYTTVIRSDDGTAYVTRPSLITNAINTVPIPANYDKVVEFLANRNAGMRTNLVQDEFPDLSPAQREFLMTGITDKEWQTHLSDANDLAGEEGDIA